jgi:hypothetical protein
MILRLANGWPRSDGLSRLRRICAAVITRPENPKGERSSDQPIGLAAGARLVQTAMCGSKPATLALSGIVGRALRLKTVAKPNIFPRLKIRTYTGMGRVELRR